MKKTSLLLLITPIVLLSACTVNKENNVLYTSDLQSIDLVGLKKGTACSTRILFFGPFGSKSMALAAQNGFIQKPLIVERYHQEYIIAGEDCTDVYGK